MSLSPTRTEAARSGWPAGSPGRVNHRFPPAGRAAAEVTPVRLRRHDPVGIAAIEAASRRYDRAMHRAADALGMHRPAVVSGNPLIAAYAPMAWAGSVTFYAWDDWAAYPAHRPLWPAYEQAYARIRERGCRVVAVSQVLLDRLAVAGPSMVIPNGLAVEEWERPAPRPAWFEALPTPRLLYVGTLDDRLDQDIVRLLASAFPTGSVVLVGTQPDDALAPLGRVPNVHIRPPVPRDEVAALVHGADVCVMPHRRTPLTEAMSPLKLYEYVAGGRPVVATDLPPARGIHPNIFLVPDNVGFVKEVQAALDRPPMTEDDRLSFIHASAWVSRFEELFSRLWPETVSEAR